MSQRCSFCIRRSSSNPKSTEKTTDMSFILWGLNTSPLSTFTLSVCMWGVRARDWSSDFMSHPSENIEGNQGEKSISSSGWEWGGGDRGGGVLFVPLIKKNCASIFLQQDNPPLVTISLLFHDFTLLPSSGVDGRQGTPKNGAIREQRADKRNRHAAQQWHLPPAVPLHSGWTVSKREWKKGELSSLSKLTPLPSVCLQFQQLISCPSGSSGRPEEGTLTVTSPKVQHWHLFLDLSWIVTGTLCCCWNNLSQSPRNSIFSPFLYSLPL